MDNKMTKYEIECKLKAVENAIMRHEMGESSWSSDTADLLKKEKVILEELLKEAEE